MIFLKSKINKICKIISGKLKVNFNFNIALSKNTPIKLGYEKKFFDLGEERNCQKIICIDGPGYSGSSAVGDFLGEFNNCVSYGGGESGVKFGRGETEGYEINFFRQPNGILELEKICYFNVTGIRDEAIKEFIKTCEDNYNLIGKIYDEYYLKCMSNFILELLDFRNIVSNKEIYYFPKKITVKEYRRIAKKYLGYFINHLESREFVILDNLMSISGPDMELLQDYFDNFKIIYVWSDPRDIYARARLNKGNDWVAEDPEIFGKTFLRVLPRYINSNDSRVLCVNFDELCNNYKKETKKVMDFVGLNEKDHTLPLKYFNPEVSIHNTKVYKKLSNQEPIEKIFTELKQFCYL